VQWLTSLFSTTTNLRDDYSLHTNGENMENKEAVTGQLTDNPNVAGANWSYVSPPQPIASAPDRGCISNSPNDLDKSSSEVAGAGT
jgi:hypothetical protein